MPNCWIIADPNGAGKTTLIGRTYLRLIERLRADGLRVELIDLSVPAECGNVETARGRTGRPRRAQHSGGGYRAAFSPQPAPSFERFQSSGRSPVS
jgi:predicted ABC-type ATPase